MIRKRVTSIFTYRLMILTMENVLHSQSEIFLQYRYRNEITYSYEYIDQCNNVYKENKEVKVIVDIYKS